MNLADYKDSESTLWGHWCCRNFCYTVWYCPLPEFQLKRLQRVQLLAASFVLSKYVNDINDIVKIGWLPVRQRRDFHVLKLVHKAFHSPSWPSHRYH